MIASLILATLLAGSSAAPQQPPAPAASSAQAAQEPEATELDEVVVEGQRVREAAEAYVRSVAAPVRGRKVARWRNSVCVGVGGLQPEAARFMVDRVSDWAHSIGLTIEPPGCKPQIFIVATADGDATARALVLSRPREFRTGVADADQGSTALEAFQTSDRLIRWWHVSLPVNDDTGMPIRRLPGSPPFIAPAQMTRPSDFGPFGMVVQSSRLTDQSRDDMMQAIIVLDTAALDQASFAQITDYIAMVALAQINPDAEPGHPSILGLFNADEAQEETLTDWDRAYLRGLYRAQQRSAGGDSNLSSIAAALAQELQAPLARPDDPTSPH